MGELESWYQDIDGVRYLVRVVPDLDSTPQEYDCYAEAQVKAWKNGEWQFAEVIVTPWIAGLDEEWFGTSVGAVEYGDFPTTDTDGNLTGLLYDTTAYIRDDLVPELARQVWAESGVVSRLANLRDALNRILLTL